VSFIDHWCTSHCGEHRLLFARIQKFAVHGTEIKEKKQ